MKVRLFIITALLCGFYGGAHFAKDRGIPTEVAPVEMKVQDLPMTFGEWKGEDIALDPELFKAIGAKMVVNRQYRDRHNQVASLHLAVFDEVDGVTCIPHPPEMCYPGAGWTFQEAKNISLDKDSATESVARFQPIERRGEAGYLLYWYHFNGSTYYNKDGQRNLFLACRGRPVRTPIVKVLLQTSAASPADAEAALKSLGEKVYTWSRGFH